MSDPIASVVIGFKDWGLDRLRRCIVSVFNSFADVEVEVIVSDFGSADGASIARACQETNARYVRTETDGTWSRSRAINAGFAQAHGSQFFATDADMIFTPGALFAVSDRLAAIPGEGLILQCRDLPPSVDMDASEEIDWPELERVSSLRPRWGMGGLVGMHREIFERLRGYDDRMHTYGGEDIDYAKRMRRFGVPINWFDVPGVRMYHVWHPSSRLAAAHEESAETAITYNRRIHSRDLTTVRNRTTSSDPARSTPPIVTIVAGADRPRDELVGELGHILGQTVVDVELLIVGESDVAIAVAQGLDDARVRVASPQAGPWWHAANDARGTYTMLHAPGSYYAPDRLERLLSSTTERHVMPADCGVVAYMSAQGDLLQVQTLDDIPERRAWASLLMPTSTVRSVLKTLEPLAEDPNDLAFALLRNGLGVDGLAEPLRVEVLANSFEENEVLLDALDRRSRHLLRRLQASDLHVDWLLRHPDDGVKGALRTAQQQMRGEVDIVVWGSDDQLLESAVRDASTSTGGRARTSWVTDASGQRLFGLVEAAGVPESTARTLDRRITLNAQQGEVRMEIARDENLFTPGVTLAYILQEYSRLYSSDPDRAVWLMAQATAGQPLAEALVEVEKLPNFSVVMHRILKEEGAPDQHLLLGLLGESGGLAALSVARERIAADVSVELWFSRECDETTLAALTEEGS